MATRGGPTVPAIDFFGGEFREQDLAFPALRPTSLFIDYAEVTYTETHYSVRPSQAARAAGLDLPPLAFSGEEAAPPYEQPPSHEQIDGLFDIFS